MKQYVWQKENDYYSAEIKLDMPPGANFMYRQGNNMGMRLEPSCIFNPGTFEGEYSSEDVIVVGDTRCNKFVLAGAATAFRSMSYFSLMVKGRLFDSIVVKQFNIKSGEKPEQLVVLEGDDWRKLLIEYAEITAKAMNVPAFDTSKNLTGYCTWYYYYASVTEADFLENLDAMKNHLSSSYPAQVIQIDDGYQTFQGDWLDQDASWPTPLPVIAKRITDTGMQAGIWLMPFQASTASKVCREHPDWFVKDEDGNVKVAPGWSPAPDHLWACLDMTNPEAREHIAKVFKAFRSMGFSYFKMDGLGFGLMEGKRMDPNATSVSAFREGLKAIREAVPDSYLLGCCPPFMPCLGYVDACRISGDTAAAWEPIKNAFHETSSRWWMYDRFFRCDPDTLMARQDRAKHTLGEARISVLNGIITGISITSDNLNTIATDRLELLGRSAKYRLRDAMPITWGQNGWAQTFSGTVNGKKAVAIFHDLDEDKTYEFKELGLNGDVEEVLQPLGTLSTSIRLAAHDAALLIEK